MCTVTRGEIAEDHPQFKTLNDSQWDRFKRVYDENHSQYVFELLVGMDIPEVSEDEEAEKQQVATTRGYEEWLVTDIPKFKEAHKLHRFNYDRGLWEVYLGAGHFGKADLAQAPIHILNIVSM